MPRRSAGLLLYRQGKAGLEVFLVHPGGPFWAKKDVGAWSIPKGEYQEGEDPLAAARREFLEETGFAVTGNYLELGTVKQAGGKLVTAWALEGDCDPEELTSSRFRMEWPPRSGKWVEIPEVDRGAWFRMEPARERILIGQIPFLDALEQRLNDALKGSHAGAED